MAKQSGIGSYLFVNQYDLSGDIGSIQTIGRTRNLQDVSNIQQDSVQRLGLLKDGQMSYVGFFNAAAGATHPVLSALNGAQSLFTWASGATVGAVSGSMQARQGDFSEVRGADGSLVLNASAQGDGYALEWGQMLTTGKQTIASAANGTAVDGGASTSHGFAAYLHVISLASGTATVAIQDSADNSSFSAVTGGGFTAATGATKQRIQTATNGTVRRYVRINVSGTFSNLVCAVSFVRYLAAP